MNRTIITAAWLMRASLMAALITPMALSASEKDDVAVAVKAAQAREAKWFAEKTRIGSKSSAERAHMKLHSEPREETWSSSMENELRGYFDGKTGFSIIRVDCRRLMCEVLTDGEYAQEATANWWASIEELRKQQWYQTNFLRDYGVGVEFFPRGGAIKQPTDTKEWAGSWLMLRRDARTNSMSEQMLWQQLSWPRQSRSIVNDAEAR
jgi:hypothetical protein